MWLVIKNVSDFVYLHRYPDAVLQTSLTYVAHKSHGKFNVYIDSKVLLNICST